MTVTTFWSTETKFCQLPQMWDRYSSQTLCKSSIRKGHGQDFITKSWFLCRERGVLGDPVGKNIVKKVILGHNNGD